jgi:hypothetical protein
MESAQAGMNCHTAIAVTCCNWNAPVGSKEIISVVIVQLLAQLGVDDRNDLGTTTQTILLSIDVVISKQAADRLQIAVKIQHEQIALREVLVVFGSCLQVGREREAV